MGHAAATSSKIQAELPEPSVSLKVTSSSARSGAPCARLSRRPLSVPNFAHSLRPRCASWAPR
eukprot:629451-Pyramimonas_sp.AAC.1